MNLAPGESGAVEGAGGKPVPTRRFTAIHNLQGIEFRFPIEVPIQPRAFKEREAGVGDQENSPPGHAAAPCADGL